MTISTNRVGRYFMGRPALANQGMLVASPFSSRISWLCLALFCFEAHLHAVAPRIFSEPQDQTVRALQSVTFSMMATGDAPLSYQWHFNGSPLVNRTNSSLLLQFVQPTNSGRYSVTVSNAEGIAVSRDAVLQVCQEAVAGPIEPVPTASYMQYGTLVKFDAEDNIYLGSDAFDSLETNGFTFTKLSSDFRQAWQVALRPPPDFPILALIDFAIGSTGSVFLLGTGTTNPAASDLHEIFIWSYTREGALRWSNHYPSRGYPRGIAVAANGATYVVNTTQEKSLPFIGSLGGNRTPESNIDLVKFDANGQHCWTSTYTGWGHDNTTISAPAVGPNGDICFATAFLGVALYRDDGTLRWAWTNSFLGRPGSLSAHIDPSGDVIVGARIYGPNNPWDRNQTFKIGADGNLQWRILELFSTGDRSVPTIREVDEFGNVYAAAIDYFSRQLTVTKRDPQGRVLWWVIFPDDPWSVSPAMRWRTDEQVRVAVHEYTGELKLAHIIQYAPMGSPIIRSMPNNLTNYTGSLLRFDPSVTGEPPLFYQWRRNGIDLSGATNATLVLTNAALSDQGNYSLRVTNGMGCAVSVDIQVVLTNAPAPRLEQVGLTDRQLTFTLVGQTNLQYQIETSPDLVNWTWCCSSGVGPITVDKPAQASLFVRVGVYVP